MNPEIHSILDDMQQRCPKNPLATSDVQTYLSVQASRLHVLLAEEAEKQSNKISEQTEKMIRFTKAIVFLTWALLFVGVTQIVTMIFTIIVKY